MPYMVVYMTYVVVYMAYMVVIPVVITFSKADAERLRLIKREL